MVTGAASATGRAEHSRVPVVGKQWPCGQLAPLVSHRVPDDEVARPPAPDTEEDAAVAGIERAPLAAVGVGWTEGVGGDEAGQVDVVEILVDTVADEVEHGGRVVELMESAAEAATGHEAAPGRRGRGYRARPEGGGGGSPRRALPTESGPAPLQPC